MPPLEGAIAPAQFYSFKDTVDQGEPIEWKMAFRNVSDQSFDSLQARLFITNTANQLIQFTPPTIRPLPAGDSVQVGVSFSSSKLPGSNLLQLEINPLPGQVEQYHFNNVAYKNVYVRPDRIAPLLDVTIDGKHITNGEKVLNHPDIVLSLHDESKWLPLNDTSSITVWLRYPSGTLRRFYYTNDTLRFFPSTRVGLPNKAISQLRPYLKETGLYELIVSAKDIAGNKAGALDYKVTFRIAELVPQFTLSFYPNPFSTSSKIAYTLWGDVIPSNILLQIFNEGGQLVRGVSAAELGPLRIGRNVSLFEWDGKDAAGHQMANGVYLCRLVATETTTASPYPQKGSLVILAQGKILLQR